MKIKTDIINMTKFTTLDIEEELTFDMQPKESPTSPPNTQQEPTC